MEHIKQDEALRAEILQDVQRLPDEPFYHEPRTQTLILDILFIYCKLNPDVGGYRQGMHELLAPVAYVLEQDAIDPNGTAIGGAADLTMVEMLDANFIEHDALHSFSKLMERAKFFYETSDDSKISQSTIVEKSQHIHEVLLYKVDPDLSSHLKNIEVLPQNLSDPLDPTAFFSRVSFRPDAGSWDTLFSIDPSLDLVDLICTAMLLRIRWELLEADYSTALQLLLKYPAPQAHHGPHTFIDDAAYLRTHLNTDGGSTLVMKYTGKIPETAENSRPTTPRASGFEARHNARGARSPLSPSRLPTRFLQQQGGVEALFQGAAKGILERSEKLGVNQAVRDALVEIRRNVSEARSTMKANSRDLFSEPGPNTIAMQAVDALDRRNKQLAAILDESLENLRALVSSDMEDKKKHAEALEIAVAKIQFVKVYLEDSTVALPEGERLASEVPAEVSPGRTEPYLPTDAVSAMAIGTPRTEEDPHEQGTGQASASTLVAEAAEAEQANAPDAMDTDPPSTSRTATPTQAASLQRPHAPIPTRSTLAQSSFAWMLEPDQSASSATAQKPSAFESSSSPSSSSSSSKPRPANKHHKKPSANANREKTAFLFGEVPSGADDGKGVLPEDIFGLQPMGKSKERGRLWDD